MSDNSATFEIFVPNSPEQVFDAVTNVRGWWNEGIDGGTAEVGDEFTFTDHRELRCRFRLTEVTPASRVVWEVLDSHLSFVQDHNEWTGTRVIFEITPTPGGTSLRFTHQGLRPAVECYEACSRGWDFYINQSLRNLITSGAGHPIELLILFEPGLKSPAVPASSAGIEGLPACPVAHSPTAWSRSRRAPAECRPALRLWRHVSSINPPSARSRPTRSITSATPVTSSPT